MSTERKWKRMRNGSRELCSESGTHAVVEPSRHRGWWWWTTWGRDGGDVGGLAQYLLVATETAERKASGNE